MPERSDVASTMIGQLRDAVPDLLVATDFDGTLAPLTPDPEKSRPVAGAIETLGDLSRAGARIAVITGRDARTVARLGGLEAVPDLVVAGIYGIETWRAGVVETPPEPASLLALRVRLPGVLAGAGADPAVWVEDKRLSLVVHARRATDPAAALAPLDAPVRAIAAELGLEVHPGRDVLELRIAGYDKGGALRRLAGDAGAVVYLGDDLGDLPAFAEIARLREAGRTAWGIAVTHDVPEVGEAADLTVAGPAEAVAFLRALLP